MSVPDFAALLHQTFADRRLAGGERDALRQALAGAELSPADRAALRNRAFDLAEGALTDPAARQVLDWLGDVVRLLWPPAAKAEAAGAEAYFSPHDDCTGRIQRLFHDARRRADLCVFTITDDRIADAVLAAHRRGVALRVITDNDKAHDLGSDVERLRAAGVAVRIDRTPFHMHHKYAIFDGKRLLNGSYNWTRGAARDNEENIVITDDPTLLARFQAEFERLWSALA